MAKWVKYSWKKCKEVEDNFGRVVYEIWKTKTCEGKNLTKCFHKPAFSLRKQTNEILPRKCRTINVRKEFILKDN